jgi:hypothetical protein
VDDPDSLPFEAPPEGSAEQLERASDRGTGMGRPSGASGFRVDEGEEAVVAAGPPERALIRSRGFLPLRVRSEGIPYRRPAFCGTAVVLGEQTYEVVQETETPDGAVYALRPWPEGEVVRDRVAYGPRLVRAARADRERAATRKRARPYRYFLYPLVGLLPEEPQERAADRLGLYSVTATIASGLVEAVLPLVTIWLASRTADDGLRVAFVLVTPPLSLISLSGLARAFAAWAFHETSGSYLVEVAYAAMKGLGRARRDPTLVPLTREAFWSRLEVPDKVTPERDGVLVFRGLLPHLTWPTGHHVQAGDDYWLVEALPPALQRGRMVYSYRLVAAARPDSAASPPEPPSAHAYAAEVWAGIRREWADLLGAFSWHASLLGGAVQRRAFADRGGPRAARRPTSVTALAGLALGVFVLAQPHEAADPLGPWIRLVALLLLVDGGLRIARTLSGAYAPSLFRFVLPSDCLRPERIAYQAHRDAERGVRS